MSIKVMTAVWDSAVPAPERFTLLALADAANDDGWCWPSVATIGRKVRLHETTVQRHLSQLVEQGLLERRQRPGHSTMYRVVVAALPADDDPPADRYPPQNAGGSKSLGDPPANRYPTPPQSATQNRKEPSRNRHTPAHSAGESDDGALPLDVPVIGSDRTERIKPDPLRGFEAFWREYPRKVAKDAARKAWTQKVTGAGLDPERVTAAARAHAARWQAEQREQRYMPHPASWLRAGSYDDELPTEAPRGPRGLVPIPDPAVTGKRRIQCG